tara:strand:- start:17 stop:190 length:174 start_codon:yes stop_codon:yes gene_type:complete
MKTVPKNFLHKPKKEETLAEEREEKIRKYTPKTKKNTKLPFGDKPLLDAYQTAGWTR